MLCPADHRVKLKESKTKDKYLDHFRELKKNQQLWNVKVTVITFVIGSLCTFPNGLVQRLENMEITGRVENIQTTALLR